MPPTSPDKLAINAACIMTLRHDDVQSTKPIDALPQLFGDELTALVTYDRRMAAAANLVDLRVAAPR